MRGCIFDLDGTLTDSLDSLTYSVNLTLKRWGCLELRKNNAGCL